MKTREKIIHAKSDINNMAEKDNIEDQLQHLFDDYEMSADNRVWENIEAELTKSKNRLIHTYDIFEAKNISG